MMRVIALVAAVVAGVAAQAARAAGPTPIPPAPTDFVTDHAGFLSPAVAAQLSQKLADYQRGTGHQLIVWIDKTTGGVPIEDWAVKAFGAWGVGRKGHDDGIAVFVFSDDRQVKIEVGYGLEGSVPDARAGRIIKNDMVPRIKAGDRDGAVSVAVDELIAAIGGAPEPPHAAAKGSPFAIVFPILFFIAVLLFIRRHPWALLLIGSGRGGWRGGGGWGGGGFGGGGGWGGGGGGGFSGGGGSSGGGGASGGW